MAALKRPVAASLPKDKLQEIATFKNSLRRWQAQWKAQKAAQELAAKEAPKS